MTRSLTAHHEPRTHRATTVAIGLALLLGARTAGAVGQDVPFSIRVDGGKVSARIAASPLSAVMDELGRLTGAAVEWRGGRDEELVSVEFADLALRDAIGRVLGTRNYLLVVQRDDAGNPLRRIVIMSVPRSGADRVESFAPAIGEPFPAAAPVHRFAGHTAPPPVPVAPFPPARSAASFADVEPAFASVLANPDPSARREMLIHLNALDPGDPRRSLVLGHLLNDADPGIRQAALELDSATRENNPPRGPRSRKAHRPVDSRS
jgi:hypothetical protein